MPDRPTTNSYRLVVFDEVEDPDSVRELLCRTTGIHATDANRWVSRMPGIGERSLTLEEVKNLLNGLYELGMAAEARTAEAIPVIWPVRTVHTLACVPEGFQVSGLRGEPIHWIPWDKLVVIDAGLIEQPDDERLVIPANWISGVKAGFNAVVRRPQMIARRQHTVKFNREPVGEVILVRSEPTLAFRLPANALNYRYLGPRLRPSTGENFPLLLKDLQQYSQYRTMTRPTQIWAESGNQATAPKYDSSQALIDHATLALLWTWYRKDRNQESPLDGSTEF